MCNFLRISIWSFSGGKENFESSAYIISSSFVFPVCLLGFLLFFVVFFLVAFGLVDYLSCLFGIPLVGVVYFAVLCLRPHFCLFRCLLLLRSGLY